MQQLRTLASANPVDGRPSHLQLILRLTDGSHKILEEERTVTVSAGPSLPMTSLALRTMSRARCATRTSLSMLSEVQTAESGILFSLFALLHHAALLCCTVTAPSEPVT